MEITLKIIIMVYKTSHVKYATSIYLSSVQSKGSNELLNFLKSTSFKKVLSPSIYPIILFYLPPEHYNVD